MTLRVLLVASLGWLGFGCYEPLGDLCHPQDPTCAEECVNRECGPAPGVDGLSCGSCDGPNPHCTPDGLCVDDCLGRECGPSPNEQHSCGICQTGFACGADGLCQDTCIVDCGDGTCRAADGCCAAAECGTGNWSCEANRCVCAEQACDDGYCHAAGECCVDVEDDEYCGSGRICEGRTCVAGDLGELLVDGWFCYLDGFPCPTEVATPAGPIWTLQAEDLRFTNVTITGGGWLTAPAVDSNGERGRLVIDATGTIRLEVDGFAIMSGKGWGGGGGGGGIQYCDGFADCKFGLGGQTGSGFLDGVNGVDGDEKQCVNQGYSPDLVGSGSGGNGGGFGGQQGQNGGYCAQACDNPPDPMEDSGGGSGGGPYGGIGGATHGNANVCSFHPCCNDIAGDPMCGFLNDEPAYLLAEPAESGRHGGYADFESNGDSTVDESVLIGSGGGGGAGGAKSNSHCCGGGDGGPGGVLGGLGRSGCGGGGGGGGGAAGGGAIEFRGRDLVLAGTMEANGAGRADLGGGYGAGGGILLYARHSIAYDAGTQLSTLGGKADGTGSPENGGTIKFFYREFTGDLPLGAPAGRFFYSVMQ